MLVRRDSRGSGAFRFSQDSCISLSYSQSVRVDRFPTPLLEVSDGASEQDHAVDWAEQICEGVGPVTVRAGGSDFESVLIIV